MNVLNKIVARKVLEVAALRERYPEGFDPAALSSRGARRSLKAALEGAVGTVPGPRIIAEIKKASPSAGLMRNDFSPAELARAYVAGGAAAISIVTDAPFFQGELEWLAQERRRAELPLLRKEFIIDPLQLEETRAAGADAVLLIAAILGEDELARLLERAAELDLECLVEIRDEADLDKVNRVKPPIVGINNRDLRDFSIDLRTSARLAARLAPGTVVVSESGIETQDDVRTLREFGINAFLIGTSLVRAPDPAARLAELIDV